MGDSCLNRLRSVSASALLFAGAAFAQNCTDNQYRVYLVDQAGTPVPIVSGRPAFPTEEAYLAFDPALPSGSYYVHVTDQIGGADEVRSANDPNDRVVSVVNNAGVITLSLPFSSNPHPTFGHGLNGVGQSVLLGPFHSTTEDPCIFKAWYGDAWDLSLGPTWPYLILGGFDATLGRCRVRSYSQFTIGNGTGSTIAGTVFNDTNNNGARDGGETGAAGIVITLLGGPTPVTTVSDGSGAWSFPGLPAGTYTVDAAVPSGTTATTPTSRTIVVCGCGPTGRTDFGLASLLTPPGGCQGRTIGFWGNKNGEAVMNNCGGGMTSNLAFLTALNLRNSDGTCFDPTKYSQFNQWLQQANAVNMANMLSAQLAGMELNVRENGCATTTQYGGGVNGSSLIYAPGTLSANAAGFATVQAVMDEANALLGSVDCKTKLLIQDGSTLRARAEALKTALDNANNNRNIVQQTPCSRSF